MHGSLIERTGWLGEDASMVGATWIFLKVTFASYQGGKFVSEPSNRPPGTAH